MHPTMTAEQAERRVEENVRAVLGVLPEQARLERFDGGVMPCDDPTDNGPLGRVIPFVDYRITGLAPAEYGGYFDEVLDWWTHNGFRLLDDSRPAEMYVWVENEADGFRMTLKANDLGQLYLTSTSPCVWPDGTPPE